MTKQQPNSDEIVNNYRDEQFWAIAMVKSLIKSLLFAAVFTLATTTLFQGFWLWIGLGIFLAIVVPLYHLLKIQNEKEAFNELSQITDVLPEALGNQILKGVIQSTLHEDGIRPDKPLKKQVSQEIADILHNTKVIPQALDSELKQATDVHQLLRKHAKLRIVHFDTECIENNENYADLFHQHLSVTDHQFPITDVSSRVDFDEQLATLDFKYSDSEFNWEFKQNSDWVSDAFFSKLGQFVRDNSDHEFLIFPAEDQSAELIYLPKAVAAVLKQNRLLNSI